MLQKLNFKIKVTAYLHKNFRKSTKKTKKQTKITTNKQVIP